MSEIVANEGFGGGQKDMISRGLGMGRTGTEAQTDSSIFFWHPFAFGAR